MPKTTRVRTASRGGQLKIGDQWNAINIIARSQTHPLKAVCELTENSIDAKASLVRLSRRRSKGRLYLEVADDGEGIRLNDEGEPDFASIATHICDSMKRHLGDADRAGIHGEFGIGLLSFWSLGDELRMISRCKNGKLLEMHLKRGKKTYSIQPVRGQLGLGGTRVVVGPLLESTRNIVTGEKLVRYLAAELRDRIRNTGVQVQIQDHVSRKDLVVTPREFEGERIEVGQKVPTPHGGLLVELYFRDGSGGEGGVAVCKDGTRVLKNITELDHFQRSPWSDGRLEGVLDFASLTLAPGTRQGIVPDEKFEEFIQAVETLEAPLNEAIASREQAESDRASQQILKQVHKAFVSALRELPSNEYLFFDIPEAKRSLAGGGDDTPYEEHSGMAVSQQVMPAEGEEETAADEQRDLLPLELGPLATVRITPRHPRRKPGEECVLTASARDAHGQRVAEAENIAWAWRIAEGAGRIIRTEGKQFVLTCDQEGEVVVEVTATQAEQAATDRVTVKFLESVADSDKDTSKGLPSYRLEPEHGKSWRSRYDAKRNEIVINSAHRDFLSSKATASKHRRYIGKLYAKEVVLINFPHESPAEVMERLVEITLRTEDVL